MVEPILPVVLGGVAGATASQIASHSLTWLRERFGSSSDEAVDTSIQRVSTFLIDVQNRLRELENQSADPAVFQKSLESVMADPDVVASVRTAVMGAARTDDAQKHAALGRAVVERLAAPSDELQALATNRAIEVIPLVTPFQLSILGLTQLVYEIRPSLTDPKPAVSPRQMKEWFGQKLAYFLPIESIGDIQYQHLVAIGCMTHASFLGADLTNILGSEIIERDREEWGIEVKSIKGMTNLESLWDGGLKGARTTTVGKMIGIYVFDESEGARTNITWS